MEKIDEWSSKTPLGLFKMLLACIPLKPGLKHQDRVFEVVASLGPAVHSVKTSHPDAEKLLPLAVNKDLQQVMLAGVLQHAHNSMAASLDLPAPYPQAGFHDGDLTETLVITPNMVTP